MSENWKDPIDQWAHQIDLPMRFVIVAFLLRTIGELGEASRLYNQAKDHFEKLGDQSGTAKTVHQLGMIEQRKGNYEEAIRLYDQSLEIKRKLGDQTGIASTLGRLGRLAESQKDLTTAEKYYKEANQIFEKLGEKPHIELSKKDLERIRQLKEET